MKNFLLALGTCFLLLPSTQSYAQCGTGYTQALLNWDALDYYFNSGSNAAPYGYSGGNYITNAMEQTQRFGIGKTFVTIATSAAGMVKGENASHTGEVAGFTGEDAQFTPSSNGQTITLTFNEEVYNLKFTLYDVDRSQRIDFNAKNAANANQNINVAAYASTILTINNNNSATAYIVASNTAVNNNENRGTATITVAGPVKTFRLTITTVGSDATFWLSDIQACVPGSFPIDYQKTGFNKPLKGPNGDQPDYFLVTPDTNGVYMVDPATGHATLLFIDESKVYVNSFAYDPYNHLLYYISENSTVDANNRTLKRHDFNTGVSSVLVSDITATLGIPTMGSGVESAGAAFYDGALYLGIEGGKYDASGTSNDRTRETIFWRIDFDSDLNPTVAYQVFAQNSYLDASNTSIHDFGDFVIKNGVLYDFNTARNGPNYSPNYSQSKYHHFDMTTGQITVYNNPGTSSWNGQAGMGWDGTLYYFRNGSGTNSVIGKYNENGTNGTPVNITVIDGSGTWPGGSGDASENFRPPVDFGDAPSSYDPDPDGPAAHSQDPNLRLGNNFDREWVSRGQTSLADADNFDDGLLYISTYNPLSSVYLTEARVYNNTGSNATLCAWLDYNGNGVFEPHEGISMTIPSSASTQQVWLYWHSLSSSLTQGQYTYLRIRVTYASNGMTVNNPTGYYNGGEVEDFRVPVNEYALSTHQNDFDALLTTAKTVRLNWSALDESDIAAYAIERSTNNYNWEPVTFQSPNRTTGLARYEAFDGDVPQGVSYYRLKTTYVNGKVVVSNVKKIDNKGGRFFITLAPNPAINKSFVYLQSPNAGVATIELLDERGALVHKESVSLQAGTTSVNLPVTRLASGRYIVRATSAAGTFTESLIISK